MANVLFTSYRESLLATPPVMLTDDIRVILYDLADGVVDPATADFLDDIPAAGRVAVSAADMSTKTITGGTFNADDTVLPSVTGDPSELIFGYQHTGVEATSDMIWYIDTATGLDPVVPNGSNITISWNAAGIYTA